MILEEEIREWESHAPWKSMSMVEHDLILSRALVEIYSEKVIRENFAFRGGTALNKLFIKPPSRYSEDIDLVQLRPKPIGESLSAIRKHLDVWLGKPKRKFTERSVKLKYKYVTSEGKEEKLKIEINTTEHFHIYDLVEKPFAMKSGWFNGEALITTYELNELMGTKLRALYQRRKGRDLYDLFVVLKNKLIDNDSVLHVFQKHNEKIQMPVTRAMFEKSLYEKLKHVDFTYDVESLLTPDTPWDFKLAYQMVLDELVVKLPGEAWSYEAETEEAPA